MRQKIKDNEEENFYKAKSVHEIKTQGVKELVGELRRNGIGILDGEIENLFLNDVYLNSHGKLDLEGIFKISSEIISGKSITEIIDTKNIEDFLVNVIKE
jgi:hypothetical protein